MFTFTISSGEITPIEGVPDFVFEESDYEKFVESKDVFEERFPGKIFGCVDNADATHQLHDEVSDEQSVKVSSVNDVKVVYYGICNKQ